MHSRGRSPAAVMQHDLARLPPDVLPHDRERHIGRQHRIVARDLPQIVRPWVREGVGVVRFWLVYGGGVRRVGRQLVGVDGWAGRCVRRRPAWSTQPHVLDSFLDLNITGSDDGRPSRKHQQGKSDSHEGQAYGLAGTDSQKALSDFYQPRKKEKKKNHARD